MTRIEVKYEFPCGFKSEISYGSLFLFFSLDIAGLLEEVDCPIHGKKCEKKETRVLREEKNR